MPENNQKTLTTYRFRARLVAGRYSKFVAFTALVISGIDFAQLALAAVAAGVVEPEKIDKTLDRIDWYDARARPTGVRARYKNPRRPQWG